MDFIEKLKTISDRIESTKDHITTEEATKTAFVLPFLSTLGYDIFNPLEVIPEYTADLGTKKGEKVDYCIMQDNKPIIIIECKNWSENLEPHTSQLHRYYHTIEARFAIITNGIYYAFYSDLEETNKMDNRPFFEFSLQNVNEPVVTELKRFQKSNFDVEAILSTANDLKYSKQIKTVLLAQLNDPEDDFVKYILSKVYSGVRTQKVLNQFSGLIKKSSKQMLSELVNDRLKSAMEKEDEKEEPEDIHEQTNENGIETTEEELEAFRIVQSILRQHVDVSRITHRDTKNYFNVLLDDKKTQPICRLWLNRGVKYIGLFNEEKKEERQKINDLEDLFKFTDELVIILKRYLK